MTTWNQYLIFLKRKTITVIGFVAGIITLVAFFSGKQSCNDFLQTKNMSEELAKTQSNDTTSTPYLLLKKSWLNWSNDKLYIVLNGKKSKLIGAKSIIEYKLSPNESKVATIIQLQNPLFWKIIVLNISGNNRQEYSLYPNKNENRLVMDMINYRENCNELISNLIWTSESTFCVRLIGGNFSFLESNLIDSTGLYELQIDRFNSLKLLTRKY